MKEHDVIRFMGRFPDRILPKSESMMNTGHWVCAKCGTDKPQDGPCTCGSIFWVKKEDNHD